MQPGLQEGGGVEGGVLADDADEVGGGGVGVGPLRRTDPVAQEGAEGSVAQGSAQHVQHPGALVVDQEVGQDGFGIGQQTFAFEQGRVLAGPDGRQAPAHRGRTFLVLQPERFAVGREPFVQPDVGPIRRRHQVAEPVVRHLVQDHVAEAPVPPQHDAAQARAGLVLHGAAPLELDLAVAFVGERVRSDQVLEEAEHVAGGRQIVARRRLVPREDVEGQRQRAAGQVAGLLPGDVASHVHRDQVGGGRVTGFPDGAAPPGLRGLVGHEPAVGHGGERIRHRQRQAHRGLVGRVVLAGPPGVGRPGLAHGQDRRADRDQRGVALHAEQHARRVGAVALRQAMVGDPHHGPGGGPGRGRDAQLLARARQGRRRLVPVDGVHSQRFVQVDDQRVGRSAGREGQGQLHAAGDAAGGRVQAQVQIVVQDVVATVVGAGRQLHDGRQPRRPAGPLPIGGLGWRFRRGSRDRRRGRRRGGEGGQQGGGPPGVGEPKEHGLALPSGTGIG